jgi:hypothetical protein
MHARGFVSTPEPKQVPFEQAGQGATLVGANLLLKGDRAAALGFQPKGESILTQLHADLAEVAI